MHYFDEKKILVTGCCGTIGSELLTQLFAACCPAEVVGVDNNETELFFTEQRASQYKNARFHLVDMRNNRRVRDVFAGVDIVFHTAAFKHVVLCERDPLEAVANNILTAENVIRAAQACGVKRVIFTSSDKAVNPTSVMGTSKLMGERLFTAANANGNSRGTVFASTRFGNVLGSRGSVIPIFRQQIMRGGPVTLTDDLMTRFIMSIQEAARLVLDSARIAHGGEVFITKMPAIRIRDLAEVMIRELAPGFGHDPESIKIEYIGSKPGEKLYEELMSDEETARSCELERYYVVKPALRSLYENINYKYENILTDKVRCAYNSKTETLMTQPELKEFLIKHNLLGEMSTFIPSKRY